MGQRPVILFVATPGPLGGSNRSLLTLLGQLEGSVTRVLASPEGGKFPQLVKSQNLAEEYVVLPRRPRHWTDRWLRLAGGARLAWWLVRNRRRVAAIHANALTGLNLATPAALLTRKPVVVWVHDPSGSTWGSRLGPLLRRLLPRLRIAAVSATAEASAVANGLCSTGDAVIVPNPIDPADVVAPTSPDPDRRVTIGFLGGMTERKGFDLLPLVIDTLADEDVIWNLYVNLERKPRTAAVWERLDGVDPARVRAMPRVADVRQAYGAVDIVWVPSRSESFCRVAAEAMMNGIAVVASDIPPLRQLLGNDEAGLLYPTEDPAAAAAALSRLVADPELRRRLGEAGRLRADAYSPPIITAQLLELYGIG